MNGAFWQELLPEAANIWRSGGWGMFALAANGIVLFGVATRMLLRLMAVGQLSPPVANTVRGRETPGERLARAAERETDEAGVIRVFAAARHDLLAPFERDHRVLQVAVRAAPLLGLLGTVTGMLATFHGLATGGSAEKTMTIVAGGISEALITTETGLVMALVGLMFENLLLRRQQRIEEALAHLETFCLQRHHRVMAVAAVNGPGGETEPSAAIAWSQGAGA
ncbi:MAG: MotA/TolQ/ExbB proton channel family protein [Kiritimatiellae bacterium]|nr:MotA/TolQ/ExbB proton channel family protein [Kiritimatiellia bacterium]